MKKKEKIMIGVLIILTAVVTIFYINRSNSDKSQQASSTESFPNIIEEGQKLESKGNIGEKKNFEGLDIGEFQITKKDNQYSLLGIATNNSSEKHGNFIINIQLLDNKNEEVGNVQALIPEVEPESATQFNIITEVNCENIYDFVITKQTENPPVEREDSN